MSEYLEKIIKNLNAIETEESKALCEAIKKVAEVIQNDGLIFTFGCGHSHLPGLDAFYRAGGLANVSPMLDTDLMLHNGAAKSSRMEKMNGIAVKQARKDQKMLFFYIRHGDPIYNPDSLTPLGERQAEAVAHRLSLFGLDRIYASTSNRAKLTAKPTCEMLKLPMTELDWCNEGHAWNELSLPNSKERKQ